MRENEHENSLIQYLADNDLKQFVTLFQYEPEAKYSHKLLETAVLLKNWPAVLLLLTGSNIEIPDHYYKVLANSKNEIISEKNLQMDFLNIEILENSLTKKNLIGRVAHYQRGPLKPGVRHNLLFTWSSGALSRIQKELQKRRLKANSQNPKIIQDEKKDPKDFRLFENLCHLIDIDQLTAGTQAKNTASIFKKQYQQYLRKPVTPAKNMITLLLETYFNLSNYGHAAVKEKKNAHDGILISTKTHFEASKLNKAAETRSTSNKLVVFLEAILESIASTLRI